VSFQGLFDPSPAGEIGMPDDSGDLQARHLCLFFRESGNECGFSNRSKMVGPGSPIVGLAVDEDGFDDIVA